MQTPEPERRSAMADGSWMAWTAAGIAGIWVAVALISVFAPDMVSGSEQQHLPVAAFGSWLWGLAATGAFVWAMGKLRGSATRRPIWIGLTAATLAVWLVATIMKYRVAGGRDGIRPHPSAHRRDGLARGRDGAHRPGRHHGGGVRPTPESG